MYSQNFSKAMEGRRREIHRYGTFGYSYGYSKLPTYPSLISRTPLSAFHKFHTGQIHLKPPTSEQIAQIAGEEKQLRSGFAKLSPFCGSISGHASGSHPAMSSSWLHLVLPDEANSDYFSPDESSHQGKVFKSGIISFERETNHQKDIIDVVRDLKAEKRGKASTPTSIIKGQWTKEENRLLEEMVNHFGLRKWAQVADNLPRRTGKQCREHWHNYLRPDIKKDSWSEDEERLLVNAHEMFGNKWAEISKRIPGRTENSIKNHWNATKRKQMKNRKSKKMDNKNRSTVLQDYIKSKCLPETPTTSGDTEDPTVQCNNILLDLFDIDSSPLLGDPCEEEIVYMQKFFKDCNTDIIVPEAPSYDDQVTFDIPNDQLTQANNQEGFFLSFENAVDPVANPRVSTPLSSDLCMSDFFEGTEFVSSNSSSTDGYENFNDEREEESMEIENPMVRQASEDMGLLAMVYPFTHYG